MTPADRGVIGIRSMRVEVCVEVAGVRLGHH